MCQFSSVADNDGLMRFESISRSGFHKFQQSDKKDTSFTHSRVSRAQIIFFIAWVRDDWDGLGLYLAGKFVSCRKQSFDGVFF